MLNIISSFIGGIWAKLLFAGAIVVGVLLAIFKIRQGGVDAQVKDDLRAEVKDIKNANEIKETINTQSDDNIHSELYRKYSRD